MTSSSPNQSSDQDADNEVGIIMLDNSIARPIGDVGNRESYPYPVAFAVTPNARNTQVVEQSGAGLCEKFVDTARSLEHAGVSAISTSCGFLAIYQRELAASVAVPLATSSLLQIPLVLSLLKPEQRLCVLTANASTLSDRHFESVGIGADSRDRIDVVGFENTEHTYAALVAEAVVLDPRLVEREIVELARCAVARTPQIGAFVLECTNLPPYADAIGAATERPVWDAVTLIDWMRRGSRRSRATAPC
ncbi:hypothetical protein ACFVKB_03045 [Rhodococcus sp. NPDC127530]|uniref:hypothetical protein n=1 Tax=unclassified Rhodococcus (in: high G+C Gram-positive bacteria) TaxID=192944 RepID=UPI003631B47E